MQNSSHSVTTSLSYPPCFRPNSPQLSQQPNTPHDQKHELEHDPLPVIDLQHINLKKLEEACKDWGIFRLVNHGIPLTLMSKVHEHVAKVFDIGFETKQNIFESIPASVLSYFWGTPALTPAGVALYKDGDNKQSDQGTISYNWVEGLNYPLSQGSLDFCLDQYPMVRDMRTSLEEYGVHQERIAKSIFGAMSQNLTNCEENEGYLSPSTGILRVYRYPRSFFDKSTKVWGMEAHTDSSVVTILNQYEVAGLQVLSPIDEWIDAKPIPNTLLVHLGDMMQAISDDKYKSVKHRVMVNRERERISVGYFVFPDNDCVIRSSNYKPFTYLDFRNQVQHDIKNLGVKVGLSRFKLNKDFYI
ncbi:gibberellin 2-beta-dioxygenase 8 [Tanacetum coccineum]